MRGIRFHALTGWIQDWLSPSALDEITTPQKHKTALVEGLNALQGPQKAPETREMIAGIYIHGRQCTAKNGRFSQSDALKGGLTKIDSDGQPCQPPVPLAVMPKTGERRSWPPQKPTENPFIAMPKRKI